MPSEFRMDATSRKRFRLEPKYRLIKAGLTISEVNEWGPTQAQIDAWPALAEEAERPMLVLIAARKA